MRTKVVIDGQQVEIPVPLIIRNVGTQEDNQTRERKDLAKHKGLSRRKIPYSMRLKCEGD